MEEQGEDRGDKARCGGVEGGVLDIFVRRVKQECRLSAEVCL